MECNNLDYVIDKLAEREKAPKEKLYQVCWYGYEPDDGTLEYEAKYQRTF